MKRFPLTSRHRWALSVMERTAAWITIGLSLISSAIWRIFVTFCLRFSVPVFYKQAFLSHSTKKNRVEKIWWSSWPHAIRIRSIDLPIFIQKFSCNGSVVRAGPFSWKYNGQCLAIGTCTAPMIRFGSWSRKKSQ